ncbi:MAG: Qat anti-phage system TatD family nuclease QatD [Thermodesulfobacteriota bacterium]|nr:Qat anti-phage system TatD family nuclease QatD [Thermodesulfobacteriota bacterium]
MIDVHCHIDLYSDPLKAASKAEINGIRTIAVTNLPSHFEMGYKYLKNFKRVRLALGLHPLMVKQNEGELQRFKRLLEKTNYVGEVGLDFSEHGRENQNVQRDSLRFVFECVKGKQKFISLHSRSAEGSILEMLEEFGIERAVFHWYTGTMNALEKVVKQGHFFSVNTSMIKSKNGRRIIENIPRERILTESDGPYIKIEGKTIGPVDMKITLKGLAEIWNLPVEAAEKQVDSNFDTLLRVLDKLRK